MLLWYGLASRTVGKRASEDKRIDREKANDSRGREREKQ